MKNEGYFYYVDNSYRVSDIVSADRIELHALMGGRIFRRRL